MKQPLVAPLAALAAGICAARFAELTLRETLLSVCLLALLAVVSLRLHAPLGGRAACLAGFFLTGALLASLPPPGDPSQDLHLITTVLEREQADLADAIRLRGWVREPPRDLGDADRFVLEAQTIFRDTPATGGVLVTVNRFPGAGPLKLEYGQKVEFLARLRELRNFENPGSFDYVGFLNRRKTYVRATVRPGVPFFLLEGERGSWFESVLWAARTAALGRLSILVAKGDKREPETPRQRSERHRARATPDEILAAILLGDREALDRQTMTEFQRTGTYHVLVISGLHVGLLAFLLMRLLKLLWVPRGFAAAVTIVLIGSYALLVGAGTPVLRSTWMLAAYLVTVLVFRQRRALNVIAGTALVFLIIDPELLFDVGFQLSFLAVALIAAIAVPFLDATLEPIRIALRDIWNTDRDLHASPEVADRRVALRGWLEPLVVLSGLPRTWVSCPLLTAMRGLIWVAELAVVSLVVQAGLALPLAVHFQRVSWSALTANLLIVPLLSVAAPAGLATLATGWQFPATISRWAAEHIGAIVAWHAEHLPLEMRMPPPPAWLAIAIGVAFVALACSFDRGRRTRWAAAAATAALLVVMVLHPFPPLIVSGELEMTMLDVGQGESIFLAFPDGQTMLVDGGGQPDFGDPNGPPSRREPLDIGEVVVSPYLWSRSIQRLDILAVTHADADHLAGVPALLRNFAVNELWLGDGNLDPEYDALARLARARGTFVRRIREGDRLSLGGASLDVLGPSQPPAAKRNNRSLVLCLRYGRQGFLLTGDIEQEREQALLASGELGSCSILKVPHHGSRTSSHALFLRAARPIFAVISAGRDNLYGHPHEDVLARLRQVGARVLRTDREGLISVMTDGYRLTIDTYRSEKRRQALWID